MTVLYATVLLLMSVFLSVPVFFGYHCRLGRVSERSPEDEPSGSGGGGLLMRGFFTGRMHFLSPNQQCRRTEAVTVLYRNKALGERKPPPRQLIRQTSHDCPSRAVVKISLKKIPESGSRSGSAPEANDLLPVTGPAPLK